MNKPAAEGLARSLQLFGRLPIAVLMHKPSRADDRHEQHEGNDQRAKGFDKQGLHQVMILELEVRRSDRIVRGWIQSVRANFQGNAGITSVLRKSSPLKSSGSPVAFASA